jgi:hypothetical protein
VEKWIGWRPWSSTQPAMAATATVACAREQERRGRVRRREGLGLVALVLHQAERGTGMQKGKGGAASMVETRGCMAATPSPKGQLSSRWQATTKPGGYTMLGSIQADF